MLYENKLGYPNTKGPPEVEHNSAINKTRKTKIMFKIE